MLWMWKMSEPAVLEHIPPQQPAQEITTTSSFTKVLGIEWNATLDWFLPLLSTFTPLEILTNWALVSDIAQLFHVLGWCSPTIIKPKIMLQ